MPTALAFEMLGDDETLLIRCADGVCVSRDLTELLSFLQFSGRHVVRVVFELDEFVAPLLRRLPLESLTDLVSNRVTTFGRFRICYLPGILFQVGKVGQQFGTRYYGIKNFLNIPGNLPQPPLGDVQSAGQEVLDAIDLIGIGGDHIQLTTSGAVFASSDIGSKFMSGLPLDRHLFPAVLVDTVSLSVLADDKYWVTAHAIGRWSEGEIWDYDLTAAFASIASKLYDTRDLTFWRSDKVDDKALYGVVRGKFYLDPSAEFAHCSPIIVKAELGDINPLGYLPEDVYTLEEIRTVERYELGTFHPVGRGIFASILGSVHPRFPYRDIMSWLYEKRSLSDMSSSVSKVASNAIIGKMIERRDGAEYRNRFYHAIVTAQTRCLVTKFLVENGVRADELLSIQTDGVKLTRNIALRNVGMGTWRNNGSQPTIIHSGHKVYVGDKRPYQITFEDVETMVAEHPNIERYGRKVPHRVTMREALDAGDISKVGETVDFPAYFDLVRLEDQQTRVFGKLPRTGRELLNNKYYSKPIVMED